MLSKSEEDYLKSIFLLELDSITKTISTNFIADRLQTKASSVTDMIKKLQLKKLVIYTKYKGVYLSKSGKILAATIVRKHRLWETFLVSKLDFPWDEVHEIAEQLEHIKSDKLINKLDYFLDFPKQDPHGEPIPDKNGKMRKQNSILLSNAHINKKYSICGIKNSEASFLQYMDSIDLKINSVFTVINRVDFDDSVSITMYNSDINLSKKVCDNLYIKIH